MHSNIWFKLLRKYLSKVIEGSIEIRLGLDTCIEQFGHLDSELKAIIFVQDVSVFRSMVLGGSVGTAEAYMDGKWECDCLKSLFLIFIKNYDALNKVDGLLSSVSNFFNAVKNLSTRNTIVQSRKNIQAHYDLSNTFYQLILDDTMMYSAGYFKSKNIDLKTASVAKIDRICKKLALKKTDSVLEIGTGWGGFAIYAAQNYGCHVTTTTISQAQYDFVKHKINSLGLESKITLLLKDYRHLSGSYDKLVSIEMIEAVGAKYFSEYFKVCSERLKPNGIFLLQAITIADQFYHQYKQDVDFIKKHIFPGGCLPSLQEIINNTAKHTNLQVQDVFSLGHDYALTLKLWGENFEKNLAKIKQLGFDMKFIRMWRYYLQYCEAGFIQGHINDFQISFKKSEHFS